MIVRHRFSFTNAALATEWYGGSLVEYEKHNQLVRHVADVEAARKTGRRVVKAATLVDQSPPDLDGSAFVWVTELDDNEAK